MALELLTILLAAIFVSAATIYCKLIYTYWEERRVPGPKPALLLGNCQNLLAKKRTPYGHMKLLYDNAREREEKHCGIYVFTLPTYMPIDPDYVKLILAEDFEHFTSRGEYYDEKSDPISAHLFSMEGHRWKTLRAKLTPTFTSGKMKTMFPTVVECGEHMLRLIERIPNEPLDVKEVFGCFTTNVIGACAFGLDCSGDPKFRANSAKVFAPSFGVMLRILFCVCFSELTKALGVKIVNPEVASFFKDVVQKTVEYRKVNNERRNDFLQILMDLGNADGGASALTMDEMAAQGFLFFAAGFETSSSTMVFCLYELALNAYIQDKVRDEVNDVLARHGGELTYEAIAELKYMRQVIDETLRKYPTLAILNRKCTKDYVLPGSRSIIERGTRVMIPVYALHRDPEYYPDPEAFDPDRFSEENKTKRHSYAYLAFGQGPRMCIGMRFALMQVKVGLALLLKDYRFSVAEKMRRRGPLEFDKNSFLLKPTKRILLDFEKICD